jgi:hypothetical protein
MKKIGIMNTPVDFIQEGPGKNKSKKDAVPKEEPITKPTQQQASIGEAIKMGIRNVIRKDAPYELSEGAVKSGIDPALTCIGGACELYKNIGIDFSAFGGEKEGVRESRKGGKVVEYNPTFAKKYTEAGFQKLKDRDINSDELTDMIKTGDIQSGDIVQYINEKGIPEHSNVVYETDKANGLYKVYNAFKHSTSNTRGTKDAFFYNLVPNAEAFKNKKFNVYRLSPDKASQLLKEDFSKKGSIYQSRLENDVDNDVKAEKEKIRQEIKKMSPSDLEERFGVNNYNLIGEDVINKVALETYAWNMRNEDNPEELIKKYRTKDYQPISMDFALKLADKNARMKQIFNEGGDWGVPLERIHYNVMHNKGNKKK